MARSIRIESIGGGGGTPRVGGSVSRPVKTTKGKAKVNRRVNNINEVADYRTGGSVGYTYNKGKLKEVVQNDGTVKVKPRNLGKVLKRWAPSHKAEHKKYKETNTGSGPFRNPKVPVKPKASRTRSGKKSK